MEHLQDSNHMCSICSESFTGKRNLNKHLKEEHNKIKPFQCLICDRGFAMKRTLETHVIQIQTVLVPLSV